MNSHSTSQSRLPDVLLIGKWNAAAKHCRQAFLAVLVCPLLLSGCGLLTSSDPAKPGGQGGEPPPLTGQVKPATPAHEAETLYAKANVLWKQNGDICSDPALAVHLLDQAIAVRPDYADAYMRRGLAYSEMGRDEEAFADLTQAIRLDPRPDRYAYRGLGLIRQHNLGGARRDLNQSITLDKSQYRAWNFRGVVNMMEDKDAEACSDFKTGCANGDCTGYAAARKEGICR